jgi:putative transposase
VAGYNNEHFLMGIGFVTPAERHTGADIAILENGRHVYEAARIHNPARWSRNVRAWTRVDTVSLNPRDERTAPAVA